MKFLNYLYFSIKHLITLLIALVTATVCLHSAAESYYVDAQNGDDNLGEGSLISPWQTFDKALHCCPVNFHMSFI